MRNSQPEIEISFVMEGVSGAILDISVIKVKK